MAALNECQPESRFAIAIELHRTDCGWPRACIELYAETRIYGSHEYDMLLYATRTDQDIFDATWDIPDTSTVYSAPYSMVRCTLYSTVYCRLQYLRLASTVWCIVCKFQAVLQIIE